MSRQNRMGLTLNLNREKQQKEHEFEWISHFTSDFQKNIEQPITIRETIMKSSELQRCFIHNIILSIYCTVCRKILCASCMYTTMQHRKHRVIPIENAMDDIREDLKIFESKIPKIVQHCEGISNANNDYLVSMQREFSPIIVRIQQFYENLRSFIKLKQKQQIAVLKERKQQMRAEVNTYNKQLNKIQQYITEKYKSYANMNIKSELLIPSRNILENLLQSNHYIKQPHFDASKSKYSTDPQKIKTVYDDITHKIDQFVTPPLVYKDIRSKKVLSARSTDAKSKTPSFVTQLKKTQSKQVAQKKKRMSSSIAGARTVRRI